LRQKSAYAVRTASQAEETLAAAEGCAIVITDLALPQIDATELPQQLKEMARPPVILILTAHGTVTTAVEAMRQGAFYYLTKPVDPVQLQVLLEKSLEQASLTRELSLLRHQLKQKGTFGKLTGESKGMQEAYRWIELADRGTLFLDEIAEMEVSVQAKLLRILQDNAFRRVGGREELHVDVRIIAATNQAPADALAAGKLREDLFYRLNVFPISLPPLRQRPEDVLPLARTFIEEFCAENARHVVALAPEAEKALLDYRWPGNVRELRNAIQRAVVLGEGALLTAE